MPYSCLSLKWIIKGKESLKYMLLEIWEVFLYYCEEVVYFYISRLAKCIPLYLRSLFFYKIKCKPYWNIPKMHYKSLYFALTLVLLI